MSIPAELTTDDVLVAGGGIGGLATALTAARAGRSVRLVEQASQFGEIGAGLQLGPNAMRAFDRLGLYDTVARSAVFPSRAVVRDAIDGSVLTVLDFGPSFRKRYGYPYVVAHRRDVLDALLEACSSEPGVTLQNARRIVGVRETADAAEVEFADGTTERTRVLVGADGIRSRVRHLLDTSPPDFSGHVAFRGAMAVNDLPGDVRRGVPADEVLLWIGPGIHLMQYPVRSGEMYNQVAVYERPAEHTEPDGGRDELLAAFARTVPQVYDSLALIDTSRPWPVCDRTPSAEWSTDHTVLIGDAAHPMLQYLGQGACQALEDALELGTALAQHPRSARHAFAEYERVRQPLAHRCQEVARPWGGLWHSSDATVVALRNRLFRMRADDDYTDLDWLYGERESTLLVQNDPASDLLTPARAVS